jgi:hypothetical protein
MKIIKIATKGNSMKNVLMIVMALMISVVFVTMVMAQNKPAANAKDILSLALVAIVMTQDKPAANVKGISWAGVVVSVDAAAKTVAAKNKKGQMTFDVSAAKFTKNVTFKDLKASDKIVIKYIEKDGTNMATGVAKAQAVKAKNAL